MSGILDSDRHPRKTTTALGRAFWAYYDRTMQAVRPSFLPWVDTSLLEAFEARATKAPASRVAVIHSELIAKLTDAPLATEAAERDAFRLLYDEATQLVFPATTAFLRHRHALHDFTTSYSLSQVDLNSLRGIDIAAHDDPTFAYYTKKMSKRLGARVTSPDVIAYSQFFEIYGEAIALQFLRSRPGLRVARVEETDGSTPDFQCQFDGVPPFFIEVKSLDIVGGAYRHDEIMCDGIDATVEIERQQAEGRRVATSIMEIAPYQKVGDTDYDHRSLILVINTLRDKCRSAFKAEQFGLGPTFALAMTDRLLIPGGCNALAPYYDEPLQPGTCVSGVLWHLAYGTIGTPIFRIADSEGHPTLEGHLRTDGLYSDPHRPFPGLGLIMLKTEQSERKAWGLKAPHAMQENWDDDQTMAILQAACEGTNDADNCRFFDAASRI